MMPGDAVTSGWTLAIAALLLIAVGGRFARVVDEIADRTGMGEALAGALLLGATTSLPGLITTVRAAAAAQPDLAVSNAVGGIAAQTTFLAIADLTHRRVNLEHAAASLPNLLQTLVLIALVALMMLASLGPDPSSLGIHPVSGLLVAGYLFGLSRARKVRDRPMWRPRRTAETRVDVPQPDASTASATRLWGEFAALAAAVAGCGWAVSSAGLSLVRDTELSGGLVGALLTSVITSLPELVTAIAAVRAGALTLAVADIVGGNSFDVLFVAAADVAYREGSVYAAIGPSTSFLLALTVLLSCVLAAGMILRERRGIGFEGMAILAIYGVGLATLVSMG